MSDSRVMIASRPIRAALVRELTAAVNAWARGRQQREVTVRSKRIATREADAIAGLRRAATEARLLIADRTVRASALRALAQAGRAIRRGAADRRKQFDNPTHRPDQRAFREDCRAAAQRHHVPIPTAARLIVERIVPTLPKPQRTALLGSWPTIDEQVKYLTERLRRRR